MLWFVSASIAETPLVSCFVSVYWFSNSAQELRVTVRLPYGSDGVVVGVLLPGVVGCWLGLVGVGLVGVPLGSLGPGTLAFVELVVAVAP